MVRARSGRRGGRRRGGAGGGRRRWIGRLTPASSGRRSRYTLVPRWGAMPPQTATDPHHGAPLASATASPVRSPRTSVSISCDDCALRESPACDDCLVSFVLGREPDDAMVIDAEEARAVRMLTRVGLVPRLRHSAVEGDWAAG